MNWQVEFLRDAVKGQLASARDHHASEHADKACWQGRIDALEGILKFCAIMCPGWGLPHKLRTDCGSSGEGCCFMY